MLTPEQIRGSDLSTTEKELRDALDSHPDVTRSAIVGHEDSAGDRSHTAYVVPKRTNPVDLDYDTLNREYVEEWQAVYDYIYASNGSGDATFDVRGWTSSYTGSEFAEEDMREWVTETVRRIRGLPAQRILELGCGTGLLLHRLADKVEAYFASDVSAGAIARIQRHFGGQVPENVRLFQSPADDLGCIAPGSVDSVVINSVTQYFLDENYLTQVLRQATSAVAVKGIVYIGDVRSAALNRPFCAGIELAKAEPDTPREQVQARTERRCCTGTELIIDPGYFVRLRKAIPRIAHVAILPRRGRRWTEMTRFRFDAVLYLDTVPDELVTVPEWRPWDDAELDLDSLRQLLAQELPNALGFLDVPNSRTADDHLVSRLLAQSDGPPTAEALRQAARSGRKTVDPEDLWSLGDDLPYAVQLSWARSAPDGAFDLALVRTEEPPATAITVNFPAEPAPSGQHTNSLWHAVAENLDPAELRAFLREKLPRQVMPSRFVMLEELPLTPDGEVDRGALASIQWA